MALNTVTGRIEAADLGRTLMHEHLAIGFPGWETDTLTPGPQRRDILARAVDRIEQMKAAGYRSLVDPCPSDLGRDAELMAEVAVRTGFNLVCATGFYHQHLGGAGYWLFRAQIDPHCADYMAEMMIAEIERGIGGSGVRPGVIKVGTSHPPFTDYERMVFRAAAKASLATGTPVMTHTDGILGDEQLAALTGAGVQAGRIIVGHCCCTADQDYHARLAATGAFLGFDRFGLDVVFPDTERVRCLLALWRRGHLDQLIVSHDSVWCFRGGFPPPHMLAEVERTNHPLHFERVIAPQLREAGMGAADIDRLLVDNPRRFFAGDVPAGAL